VAVTVRCVALRLTVSCAQLRRKERLLNLMEKSPKNVDLHRQIQTAGNLVQVMGDFRYFLEK